jgi:N-acetylglucosaminyldiphosphoundecaprenol N-acetyl-beta-D-mannosaminyltransferase
MAMPAAPAPTIHTSVARSWSGGSSLDPRIMTGYGRYLFSEGCAPGRKVAGILMYNLGILQIPVRSLMSIVQPLDNYDLTEFTQIAAEFGQNRLGYVVTPNVDHLIRVHDDPFFRTTYHGADYVVLDSRFLSYVLAVARGIHPRVVTGSDLTAELFKKVIAADDRIVIVGGDEEQIRTLRLKFGLTNVIHMNPPMGFIRDPAEVLKSLDFIEQNSPFRFCFLAVGAPQQEILAYKLKLRGVAKGLALCIGASINLLTGAERRAPLWLQRTGFEWVYRLIQDPRRLAKRYLVRGPRVFGLLRKTEITLRRVPQHETAVE